MQISDLFWKTHTIPYITIGSGVDYNFEKDGKNSFHLHLNKGDI